jgi:hypothetical protein
MFTILLENPFYLGRLNLTISERVTGTCCVLIACLLASAEAVRIVVFFSFFILWGICVA